MEVLLDTVAGSRPATWEANLKHLSTLVRPCATKLSSCGDWLLSIQAFLAKNAIYFDNSLANGTLRLLTRSQRAKA
jgi:hypothetical protein